MSAGPGEISGDSYGFEPVAVKGQFRLFGGLAYVSRNLHKFIVLLDFKAHRSYTCLYALRGEGEVFRYQGVTNHRQLAEDLGSAQLTSPVKI